MASTLAAFVITTWSVHKRQAGSEVIKLFSYSTQLSMKFQMPISIKSTANSAFLGSDKLIMLFFMVI